MTAVTSFFQSLWRFPKSILLAIAGIIFALYYVNTHALKQPPQVPVRAPVEKPYSHSLAGVGIVEGAEDNVAVAPFYAGRVAAVYVREGETVVAGQPLFALDTQELQASVTARAAELGAQQAALQRLQQEPRAEDIPPARAKVAAAEADYQQQAQHLARLEPLVATRAVSADELANSRLQAEAAKARLAEAQASLKRLEAGAWKPDMLQQQQRVKLAQAQLQELNVRRTQAVVRAPMSATVLQCNLRPGEWAAPMDALTDDAKAPVLLQRAGQMQVRVDVDEVNASRVHPGAQAKAFVKGNPELNFPLKFVRIEPLMVPKKNLTGDTAERHDVRVLQIIYAFTPPAFPLYVGQQIEVYIEQAADDERSTGANDRLHQEQKS